MPDRTHEIPSAAIGRRRLQREPSGRKATVTVRVSDRELAQLNETAGGIGVSTQRLLLESALSRRTMTATEIQALRREFRIARHQVAVIGQSFARIADVASSTGDLPLELTKLSREATQAVQRLETALAMLPKASET